MYLKKIFHLKAYRTGFDKLVTLNPYTEVHNKGVGDNPSTPPVMGGKGGFINTFSSLPDSMSFSRDYERKRVGYR